MPNIEPRCLNLGGSDFDDCFPRARTVHNKWETAALNSNDAMTWWARKTRKTPHDDERSPSEAAWGGATD
ncbi:hypothetical protein Fuma_05631 [Fuerstiella marisgermanici]|uniref:Uncharacterized protein n=1 Tax=Fuerstiella marisgermanici TaxID=1891926 RepID=A0A1P8WPJ4_9PLAN|nr:hypothetical protein Fuma_05631 [Fuerstiella marisgermanici]